MDNAGLKIFLASFYCMGSILIGVGLYEFLTTNKWIKEQNITNFVAVVVFWPIVMLILIVKLSLQILKSLFIILKDILINKENKKDTGK